MKTLQLDYMTLKMWPVKTNTMAAAAADGAGQTVFTVFTAACEPVRLATGVSQWWQNNGLIWVKWPVLAQRFCAVLAKETAWLLWLASHNGSWQAIAVILALHRCRQDVKDTRKKGSLYLCAPVSGGGSWGVAAQGKKYRMCTGLHRPTPGTFQIPHLQRK